MANSLTRTPRDLAAIKWPNSWITTKNIKNLSDYYSFDYNELTRDDLENFTGMINMVKSENPELFLLDPGESYIMKDRFSTPTVYPYPYLDFSSIKFK